MVARMIRDQAADFISLCFGINVYGSNSYTIRTFRPMVIGFLEIIRERHSNIPIVVISPIISPPREETANTAGLTIALIRQEIEAAIHSLWQLGADNLHYLHGLQFFGREFAAYLPDDLHPDAEGYRIMGSRFQQWMIEQGLREQISRQIQIEEGERR
jgi:lysophospholipase L1-like esterase